MVNFTSSKFVKNLFIVMAVLMIFLTGVITKVFIDVADEITSPAVFTMIYTFFALILVSLVFFVICGKIAVRELQKIEENNQSDYNLAQK